MQLFPTQFHDAKPFSSFNVMDLDTVDDGVWQVSLIKTPYSSCLHSRQQASLCKKIPARVGPESTSRIRCKLLRLVEVIWQTHLLNAIVSLKAFDFVLPMQLISNVVCETFQCTDDQANRKLS